MSEPADRPDEVMNRAVEAAHKALADTPGLPSNGDVSKLSKPHVELPRPIIEAAAPVLIEAERERIGAGIRSLRLNAPAWPEDDSYEAGLEAALSVIDKERWPKQHKTHDGTTLSWDKPLTQKQKAEIESVVDAALSVIDKEGEDQLVPAASSIAKRYETRAADQVTVNRADPITKQHAHKRLRAALKGGDE